MVLMVAGTIFNLERLATKDRVMIKLLIPIFALMTFSSCQSSDDEHVVVGSKGSAIDPEWEQEDLAAWRSELSGYNAIFRAIVDDLEELRDIFYDYVSDEADYATISFAEEKESVFSDIIPNRDGYDFN